MKQLIAIIATVAAATAFAADAPKAAPAPAVTAPAASAGSLLELSPTAHTAACSHSRQHVFSTHTRCSRADMLLWLAHDCRLRPGRHQGWP
jgi:hypothetical protein